MPRAPAIASRIRRSLPSQSPTVWLSEAAARCASWLSAIAVPRCSASAGAWFLLSPYAPAEDRSNPPGDQRGVASDFVEAVAAAAGVGTIVALISRENLSPIGIRVVSVRPGAWRADWRVTVRLGCAGRLAWSW